MKWQPGDYASCLANLLQGEALSVFLSLSPEDISDYQSVKKTLLRRFGCDKNGFKSKFFSAKPSQDEDFATIINRVARYFNRWLELAQVSDFDSLSFLILSEIALQPCDAEFVAYIKDHSPTSLSDLKTQATSYLDARPSKSFIKDSATSFAGESVRPTARSDSRRPSIHSYRSQTHTRANTPSLGRHTSHKSSGHRPPTHGVHSFGKSNRPFLTSKDNPRSASHQTNSKGAGSVKPPSDGACYYCGKKGHYIRDCRRRQADLSREAHVVCSQQYNCCIADAKFNRDGRLHIESASLLGSVDGPVPSACVVTRAQARKTIDNNSQNNMVPSYDPSAQSQITHTPLNCVPLADVGSRQKVDPTLKDWFNRQSGESVDAFIQDLHRLADECDYLTLKEELIRDRIVVGVRDDELSKQLQGKQDLDLTEAIRLSRQAEARTEGQNVLRLRVNLVHKFKPAAAKRFSQPKQQPQPSRANPGKKCGNCGKAPLHKKEACPARSAICHSCNKKGHYSSVCCSSKVRAIQVEEEEADNFLGSVQDLGQVEAWTAELHVDGYPSTFKLDTGAAVSVQAGLTLNEKCEFSKPVIKFLGHIIDGHGIRADPQKIEAIVEFPVPTNITELQRFLGMVNQLAKFSPELASQTEPLRQLLKRDSLWSWGHPQEQSFQAVKKNLTSTHVLAHYCAGRETIIAADASNAGLGAVLLQIQPDGSRRPVSYISRSLTPAEKNYAVIEKEALAATWASERFSEYILGSTYTIETDHKPLVPLLTTKELYKMPPRIQRFRLRLMRFSPNVIHVSGKQQISADALSRAPASAPSEEDIALVNDADVMAKQTLDGLPASSCKLQDIITQQKCDPEIVEVRNFCQRGWPETLFSTSTG
ncbi:Pol polyprotein [Plakobranchus ocellatus]|uniref:Pol polyprotein n=1 Tax=Plakobranchus ocellatus TaxID=259542 RepID=A0AAV4BPB1_9GAST|nr:Pol polyprotein [Plakobranchus ocellatus]